MCSRIGTSSSRGLASPPPWLAERQNPRDRDRAEGGDTCGPLRQALELATHAVERSYRTREHAEHEPAHMRDQIGAFAFGTKPAEENDADDERSPAHGPALRARIVLAPDVRQEHPQCGEYRSRCSDGAMQGRAEPCLEPIR